MYHKIHETDEAKREIFILRVLYQKQDWQQILKVDENYHVRKNDISL